MFPFCVPRPASWKHQGLPFLSPPLSGESGGHPLLRSQAPGYLPWVPVQMADPCDPCLCGLFLDLREEGRGSAFPEVLLATELMGRQIRVEIQTLSGSNCVALS